jgi:hypothetical protein
MKETLQTWLNTLTPPQGVLACGIRLTDASMLPKTWSPEHPLPVISALEPIIAGVFPMLRLNQLPSRRLRLVFEHGLIHACQRVDGIALVLLTSRDAEASDPAAMESLMIEFENLRPQPDIAK